MNNTNGLMNNTHVLINNTSVLMNTHMDSSTTQVYL